MGTSIFIINFTMQQSTSQKKKYHNNEQLNISIYYDVKEDKEKKYERDFYS